MNMYSRMQIPNLSQNNVGCHRSKVSEDQSLLWMGAHIRVTPCNASSPLHAMHLILRTRPVLSALNQLISNNSFLLLLSLGDDFITYHLQLITRQAQNIAPLLLFRCFKIQRYSSINFCHDTIESFTEYLFGYLSTVVLAAYSWAYDLHKQKSLGGYEPVSRIY